MEMFAWAFLGGLLGAMLMDATETVAARRGICSGVTIALVGRWSLSMMRGQFVHEDIRATPSMEGEVSAGWDFHFVVGGGLVAIGHLLFLFASGHIHDSAAQQLGLGLVYGLCTSVLPWFILLPAFGWGLFGRRGPDGCNAVIASTISHLAYGLGIGLLMAIAQLHTHHSGWLRAAVQAPFGQ